MKMKFGAIVTDGRGKIGGHVASKNRAGAYLRTKVTPVNPSTSFQQAVRNRLSGLSQAWRDLTDAQRATWNSAVEGFSRTDIFGDIKNPTGFNLYVRLNANLEVVGEAAIDEAPQPSEVANVTAGVAVVNLTGDVGTIAFTPTVPAGMAVVVRATPGQSPGKSFVKSEFRIITTLAAAATSPADIFAAYEAKFGTPVEGTRIFFQLTTVNITTGQVSVPSQTSTIVIDSV